MGIPGLEVFTQALLNTVTLFILLTGLIGLINPVFPGILVMWLGILVYMILQALSGHMTWVGWLMFVLITILMVVGNVVDNIIIAKHMRDKDIPWSSIFISFIAGLIASLFLTPLVGIIASPLGLFLAEWARKKDQRAAFENTKAWMTGWGWSFLAMFGIGILMILFWGLWVWVG